MVFQFYNKLGIRLSNYNRFLPVEQYFHLKSSSQVTLKTPLFFLFHQRWNIHIIIIIMSCRQHGYPWPSLATSPYHSSPPAGLQGYILCTHIVAVCKFELVLLLLHGHIWGSIGVHHLWGRPSFKAFYCAVVLCYFNPGRCPWCNCYRRKKWTRRHEFKSWTRLIAFHIALIPLVLQPWLGN